MIDIEEIIKFSSAYHAYNYAYNNNCRLSLKGEQLIAQPQHSYYSYLYAREILKGRFELGEKSISNNCCDSFCYAKYVLGSRFKLGEEQIAKSRYYCCCYVHDVFNSCPPLDFLELCSVKVLEHIINNYNEFFFLKVKVDNINDVVKVLFKKKLLGL